MPIFDAVAMVDWSAAATPGPRRPARDNIFIAVARGGVCAPPEYHRTRASALASLAALARAQIAAGGRLLIGVDFPLGYPAGTARALTGQGNAAALWSHLAGLIGDAQADAAGRFAVAAALNARFPGDGPFWGRPQHRDIPGLGVRKPAPAPGVPPDRRAAEHAARGAQTVWKLLGVGAAGGQALTGIAALHRLRAAGGMAAWPFDGGFAVPDAPVVLAEVYPALIQPAVDAARRPDEILDAAQVRVLAEAFAALDRDDALAPLFAAPPWLSAQARALAAREEGWILGLEAAMPPPGQVRKPEALRIAAPSLTAAAGRRAPLPIIGINEDGFDGLSPAARQALQGADAVLGGDRHPRLPIKAARLPWPEDRRALLRMLRTRGARRLAVLVHGDPLWYSLGAKITAALGPEDVEIHPNLSTFQLIAARLGWSMADADTLSCHRDPPEGILPFVQPRAHLLILATGAETPGRIARLLTARGWGDSRLSLFSAIGGAHESRVDAAARDFPATDLPFAALAVACIAGPGAHLLPAGQALPDADPGAPAPRAGMTPALSGGLGQSLRAAILARLGPFRGASLAAMGQGAAGVATDWLRAGRDMAAAAAAPPAARPEAASLGAPRLTIAADPLGAVDAVFLGPGAAHMADAARAQMRRPGRLVICADAGGAEAAAMPGGAVEPLGDHLLWSATLR